MQKWGVYCRCLLGHNNNERRKTQMNKALLEYEMKVNNKSISDMCDMLGISRSAFYRKCNGISEFTQSEIKKIVEYLNLNSPMEIFFA
jgi:ACT domain-containing protein